MKRLLKAENLIKLALSVVGLIGIVWSGLMVADSRWARAQDVAEKFQSLNKSFKGIEYQGLRREQIECEKTVRVRNLTKLEQDRCEEVKEAVEELRKELKK